MRSSSWQSKGLILGLGVAVVSIPSSSSSLLPSSSLFKFSKSEFALLNFLVYDDDEDDDDDDDMR